MKKIKRYLLIVFAAIMLVTFHPKKIFAYAGGLLEHATMDTNSGVENPENIIDQDESTSAYMPDATYVKYTLEYVSTITSYKVKATGYVDVYFYDSNNALIANYQTSDKGNISTPETHTLNLTNVKYARVVQGAGPPSTLYVFDIYGTENIPPDTTPPNTPIGLTATGGTGKITLSWSANTETDLANYKIYRDGTYYQTVSKSVTSYDDVNVTSGKTYSYTISAVDKTGNESPKTSIVTAVSTGVPDTKPPAVPTGLKATYNGGGKATITWNANTESDLAGYNLYYQGTKINTNLITGTMWQITGLVAGQTYSYQVTAVDQAGNESAKSMAASVYVAYPFSVNMVPNMDSIVIQVTGGKAPYNVIWDKGSDSFSATSYTITGLTANTNYNVTITDADGYTFTMQVNTGSFKSFVPPALSSPVSTFQRMIDNFGGAGSIALAIILAAVSLGVVVIIGLWGWRLSKKWLSSSR